MKRKPKTNLPNPLKALLRHHGITNLQLADASKLSPSRISHYLQNDGHPITHRTYSGKVIEPIAQRLILERLGMGMTDDHTEHTSQ